MIRVETLMRTIRGRTEAQAFAVVLIDRGETENYPSEIQEICLAKG
jgi:hypothetical protein